MTAPPTGDSSSRTRASGAKLAVYEPGASTVDEAGGAISASELAQGLARLALDTSAVSDEAIADLGRLLEHSLAHPSIGERRHLRIGLLVDLVAHADGEFIDTTRYEAERAWRSAAGEDSWPSASGLTRAHGHWLTAVRAACRFWFEGGAGCVHSDPSALITTQIAYEPREITRALREAQADLNLSDGIWPTHWEYLEWAKIKRSIARRSGNECRLPGTVSITRAYGPYANAVAAAART